MRIELNGKWQFKATLSDEWLTATVPGCNYLDLLDNGLIPDPFYGINEKKVQWVGEKDWEYSKKFTVGRDLLSCDFINLHMESLDTLASVYLNGKRILSAENAHRVFIVDIKPYLKAGSNSIRVVFRSPLKHIREGQQLKKYPYSNICMRGVPHIRKNQSHFGWDWGPCLPLSGITGDIQVKGYKKAFIKDVRILQDHFPDMVKLRIDISLLVCNESDRIKAAFTLKTPSGKVTEYLIKEIKDNHAFLTVEIPDPELWEANGMSERKEQPLYELEIVLNSSNIISDSRKMKIGLRTISLDTKKDHRGDNFQFLVNGIPIFARGANWIPADSFPTRVTKEKTEFLIRSMQESNMNMVRVWGGGYYETEDFYDACDKYGILVWQDFMFSCMPYDFSDKVFLDNVRAEIKDNVTRLRNRASLALWCGNNEIEVLSGLWFYRRDFISSAGKFFYKILPRWLEELDNVTPYRPGSPGSGTYLKKVNADSKGDTHLWQVWHGLKPYNYYRKRLTRFCSEFGIASLPDPETIKSFADKRDFHIKSPVILNHQKCLRGNEKILFYIASLFRIPEEFEHLIYLSQITQMKCVRDATEHWRRNMAGCHGSLFWQLNDCWPVISWSAIDYNGRWKALQYHAVKFNAPVAFTIENHRNIIKVILINDTFGTHGKTFNYLLTTFSGEIIDSGAYSINAGSLEARSIFEKDYRSAVKKNELHKRVVFAAWFSDDEMSLRTSLFVKDKDAAFEKPSYKKEVSVVNGKIKIRLSSQTYTRFVKVNVKGIGKPLSDNYFDLLPHREKIITLTLNKENNFKEEDISLLSLNDIVPKQLRVFDDLLRLRIKLTPLNIIFAIAQSIN